MVVIDEMIQKLTIRAEVNRLYDKLSELDPLSNEYERILQQIVKLSKDS